MGGRVQGHPQEQYGARGLLPPQVGAGEGAACCQNPEGRLYERNSGRGGPHREGLGVNTFPLHQQPVT